jgi:hypothetical protein
VARRDASLNTDEVWLELDPYNDDRNGFVFVLSAGGYIFDASMYNDGWMDSSWDGVWRGASRVDDQGWTGEMRIPFSQLRFKPGPDQVWGINVSRRCKRTQGHDDLFHQPRGESGHISRFPDLVGLDGVQPRANREVLVYGVGKGEYLQSDAGNPFNDGSELAYDFGGDLKWGLTSNLTLNATFNPDFGQVEVDPAVVNLSDSETFFSEKRPFFVQDASIFRYGRNGTNNNWGFNWMDAMLFYTRRIGRNPQLGINGDADHSASPTGTTILGAAKLTGKMGNTEIGALTAVTDAEFHQLYGGGTFGRELAEPRTSYSVLRTTHTAPDGSYAAGTMFTATLRDPEDPKFRETLAERAFSWGVDGWTFLDDDEVWAVRSYLAASRVEGTADAIDRQQRSSRRYFQRPDAEHLSYDPSRRNLSGWSSRIMLNKQKGNTTLNAAVGATSPGFEINDLGFQTRADIINTHVTVGRRWNNPGPLFRNRSLTVASYWTWDFGGTRNGGGAGLFYWFQFANYWSFEGSFFYNPERDLTRTTRGGPIMRAPENREFSVNLSTDPRRAWRISAYGGSSRGAPGEASAWAGLGLTLKPSSALKLTMGPDYSWYDDQAGYVTRVEDPVMTATYGDRYIFSDIEYKEVGMSMRVDWAFTPRLTLQAYAQPLIAVGDYHRLKEFAAPRTYDFNAYGETPGSSIAYDATEDEYQIDPGDGGEPFTVSNPSFTFKSIRLNTVLRWEYRPGSTFFLVWTRNGTGFSSVANLDIERDARSLLELPGEDVVMAKVTRWFDF